MAVTEAGMEMDLREEQSTKATELIVFTEVGMVTDVREVQE